MKDKKIDELSELGSVEDEIDEDIEEITCFSCGFCINWTHRIFVWKNTKM